MKNFGRNTYFHSQIIPTLLLFQTKGTMKLTVEEATELLDRVAAGRDGLYIKEDFINIMTV